MIEGFAEWSARSLYDVVDWQLQMNRILSLTRLGKIVIMQAYTDGSVQDRMFLLGSYLLVKGTHSYINAEWDSDPEWWPEYDIPIGGYAGGIPADIGDFYDSAHDVYRRTCSNGVVLVNPGASAQTVPLGGVYYRAVPVGGGVVPASGSTAGWRVDYTAVSSGTLAPGQAAVLLTSAP